MRAALLSCLVLASAAFAGPTVRGDHEVKPGGFAKLSVEGAGKTVIWYVSPKPIQQDTIAGVLVFTGTGEYTVTAVAVDFEKKTIEQTEHTVRFGAAPGPGPAPPPPPGPDVPPLPPDNPPAVAAAASGMLAVDRARLSSALRVAGAKMERAANRGDAKAILAAEVERANVVVHEALAAALEAALSAVVPDEPAGAALTPSQRAGLADVLRKAADSLGGK